MALLPHLKPIVRGAITYVPGVERLLRRPTKWSGEPRYCYSVWLRHLTLAHTHGLSAPLRTVAELGPGDSLGMGLAALLSGADRYYAFDIVRHAPSERNLEVLDGLVELFGSRAPIPDASEYPMVKPVLDGYAFPAELDDERLARLLDPERVESIRLALRGEANTHNIAITYFVPWDRDVQPESVDLVFSQACMEHIDDLDGAYESMFRWLRPGGYISHQIDFKSHRMTPEWDGHWQYSDLAWQLVRGRRSYLINREPHSGHTACIERRFEIRTLQLAQAEPDTPREKLAGRFRALSDADRSTCGAFIQAVKRAPR